MEGFTMVKKVKLPRKRKKAYTKERGNANYKGMCKLLPLDNERKFPKNVAMFPDKNTGMPAFENFGGFW